MITVQYVRKTIVLLATCCALPWCFFASVGAVEVEFASDSRVQSENISSKSGALSGHFVPAGGGLSSHQKLVIELRSNLAAFYTDLPLCIQLSTKTIIAAQELDDDAIVAVARMQRSAANLRCAGFEACRPDFEQAIQVRINPDEPELFLLYHVARTAIEHTIYPKSDCLSQLRLAADSAESSAHPDVLFASQFEIAIRTMPELPRISPGRAIEIRMKPVFDRANEISSPRDQLLSLLRHPTKVEDVYESDELLSNELTRGEFLHPEFLGLPDLLTEHSAAPRFQFEANVMAALLLEQYGQPDAACELLRTARQLMLHAGDRSAVAMADIQIGALQHRRGMDDAALSSLLSATEHIQVIATPSILTQLTSTGSQLPKLATEFRKRSTSLSSIVQLRFRDLRQQSGWIRSIVQESNRTHLQTILADTSARGDSLKIERNSAMDTSELYLRLTVIGLIGCFCLSLFLLRERRTLRRLNSQLHAEMIAGARAAEVRNQLELHIAQSVRLESLGDLAGGIAHDFNNLLVGVIGNAELLRYTEVVSERAADYLNGITKAAETAAELSRKMLTYAGKQPAQKTAVELNTMIERMLPLLRSGSGVRHNVEFTASEHSVFTEADEGQIEQVLLNLVTNASHAMANRKGVIRISVGIEVLDQVTSDSSLFGNRRESGDFVWFEIKDSGTGILHENISRVFEPFFTTKDSLHSHGFGLAVVYGHVNRHNGLIRLTTAENLGTTFRILLPRLSEFHTEIQKKAEVGQTPVKPENVTAVVVDDQLPVLQVVQRLFQANGWKSHCFESACEALEFLSEGTLVDCLVIDLMMPGVDGATMLEVLEARGLGIPVIVMSGYSTMNMTDVLRFQSVSTLVEKPFRPESLVNAICHAVSGSDNRASKIR